MKKNLIRIVLSILLLIISIIIPNKSAVYYWIKFALSIISYLIIGYDVIIKAISNIFHGEVLDENFLMFIATIGAFFIKENSEAVFVMLFYQIGELCQHYAVNKSRKSIAELMNLRPDSATIIIDGQEKIVKPDLLKIGDIIIVKPGEKIPTDGKIIDGSSSLDTSKLTGESYPKDVTLNDEVLSGSINLTATIKIEVTKEFYESTASKILDLVENATSNKAKSEQFITKFARIYTPTVVGLALIIAFVVPAILGFKENFQIFLYRALSFLVISCPCALIISIPLGYFCGIGLSSKYGILFKGSNYLELLSKINFFIFDKTGTLTKGNFVVTSINPIDISKEELLHYACLAEGDSTHPIGIALRNYNKDEIDISKRICHKQIPGKGVITTYPDLTIMAGNEKLMKDNNIEVKPQEEIGTVIHIAVNNTYYGYILIQDEIKIESYQTIKGLKELGYKDLVMFTGDREIVARYVSDKLKITESYYELLPDGKVNALNELKNEFSEATFAFMGDGINDAPVLALSDLGISMGSIGSDAAIEASDMVLMNDDLTKLLTAIKISKLTRKIVLQNIIFIIAIKIIILILSALGIGNTALAIFADVGVCLIAIINSMRILKYKKL